MADEQPTITPVTIHAWGHTRKGSRRTINEDSFSVDGDVGFYAVADGMSGPQGTGGHLASAKALEVFQKYLGNYYRDLLGYVANDTEENRYRVFEIVRDAAQNACQRVFDLANETAAQRSLGTTLSAVLCFGSKAVIAHVGHSRIYLMRNSRVYQLTEDHTFVQEQIRRGMIQPSEKAKSPLRNVLTRALGPYPRVNVDIHGMDLLPGDRLLLSSDGFHSHVRKAEIGEFLSREHGENIPMACITRVDELGGSDDTTVVTMFVEGRSEDRWAQDVSKMIAVLSRVALFSHLDYSDLVKLINIIFIKNYAQDEVIFHEDNVGDSLYVIMEGSVTISHRGVTLAQASAGDHFGEVSLFDKKPRSATVTAAERCRLLTITRKNLLELVQRDEALGIRLLWNLNKEFASRLRASSHEISALHLDGESG